eukprot:619785-Rhodomonas_salina.3
MCNQTDLHCTSFLAECVEEQIDPADRYALVPRRASILNSNQLARQSLSSQRLEWLLRRQFALKGDCVLIMEKYRGGVMMGLPEPQSAGLADENRG